MIKVRCHTNLDLCRCEKFPTELPCRPMVGDRIESNYTHDWHIMSQKKCNIKLVLEVVRVTMNNTDTVDVELHLPKTGIISNLREFYKSFYEPLTGQNFI